MSEVLKEFEYQAMRRGEISTEPIEKKASMSFGPTDDLYSDLITLAYGLRSRGYLKQANEIEERAFIFKQADVHLYRVHDEDGEDLIEFAHPDGDVEIVPSKGEYGKVETPLSQHCKILDVVLKQPKTAGLSKQSIGPVDIKEDKAGDEFEVFETAPSEVEETNKKIRQYWKNLSDAHTKLGNAIGLGTSGIYNFSAKKLLLGSGRSPGSGSPEYLETYMAYSDVAPVDIAKLGVEISNLYGDNPFSIATLVSIINSTKVSDAAGLFNKIKAIDGAIANKYFTGSVPSTLKDAAQATMVPAMVAKKIRDLNWLFADNSNSVWQFSGVPMAFHANSPNVSPAASALHGKYAGRYNNLVGNAVLQKANARLVGYLSKIIRQFTLGDAPEINPNKLEQSIKKIIKDINKIGLLIRDFSHGGKYYNVLLGHVRVFHPNTNSAFKKYNDHMEAMRRNYMALRNIALNAGGADSPLTGLNKILTEGQAAVIANTFMYAHRIWKQAIVDKIFDENSDNYDMAITNVKSSKEFADIIKAGGGKAYSYTYMRVGHLLQPTLREKPDTISKLKRAADVWLAKSRKDTGIKEAFDVGSFVKEGQKPYQQIRPTSTRTPTPTTKKQRRRVKKKKDNDIGAGKEKPSVTIFDKVPTVLTKDNIKAIDEGTVKVTRSDLSSLRSFLMMLHHYLTIAVRGEMPSKPPEPGSDQSSESESFLDFQLQAAIETAKAKAANFTGGEIILNEYAKLKEEEDDVQTAYNEAIKTLIAFMEKQGISADTISAFMHKDTSAELKASLKKIAQDIFGKQLMVQDIDDAFWWFFWRSYTVQQAALKGTNLDVDEDPIGKEYIQLAKEYYNLIFKLHQHWMRIRERFIVDGKPEKSVVDVVRGRPPKQQGDIGAGKLRGRRGRGVGGAGGAGGVYYSSSGKAMADNPAQYPPFTYPENTRERKVLNLSWLGEAYELDPKYYDWLDTWMSSTHIQPARMTNAATIYSTYKTEEGIKLSSDWARSVATRGVSRAPINPGHPGTYVRLILTGIKQLLRASFGKWSKNVGDLPQDKNLDYIIAANLRYLKSYERRLDIGINDAIRWTKTTSAASIYGR